MALPNWRRSLDVFRCCVERAAADAERSAAMEMRPPSSTRMASTKPSPSLPSRFSAGISQSSKISSLVSLARRPSLFSFLPGRKPGVPFSTTKAERPCVPLALVGDGDDDATSA
jgi:hypothetical protein